MNVKTMIIRKSTKEVLQIPAIRFTMTEAKQEAKAFIEYAYPEYKDDYEVVVVE